MSRIATVVVGLSFVAGASIAGCSRPSVDRTDPRDEVSRTTITAGTVPAAGLPASSANDSNMSNEDMSARDRSGASYASRDPMVSAQEKGDFALAQDIRDAVLADDSISSEAKGVTITVKGGTVTLRGTVEDGREHDIVLQLARERAGIAWVVDELDVAP